MELTKAQKMQVLDNRRTNIASMMFDLEVDLVVYGAQQGRDQEIESVHKRIQDLKASDEALVQFRAGL